MCLFQNCLRTDENISIFAMHFIIRFIKYVFSSWAEIPHRRIVCHGKPLFLSQVKENRWLFTDKTVCQRSFFRSCHFPCKKVYSQADFFDIQRILYRDSLLFQIQSYMIYTCFKKSVTKWRATPKGTVCLRKVLNRR